MKKTTKNDGIFSKNMSLSDRIFGITVVLLSIMIFLMILYPLWFVVIASISNSNLVNLGQITFWPKDIRFYGYDQIIKDSRIWSGYANTLLYVVAGTALNMVVTLPAAYALSRKSFQTRNKIMWTGWGNTFAGDTKWRSAAKKSQTFYAAEWRGFRLKASFVSNPQEKIYGMGQYQQEIWNLKGCNLELAHRNSQASIPFYVSRSDRDCESDSLCMGWEPALWCTCLVGRYYVYL